MVATISLRLPFSPPCSSSATPVPSLRTATRFDTPTLTPPTPNVYLTHSRPSRCTLRLPQPLLALLSATLLVLLSRPRVRHGLSRRKRSSEFPPRSDLLVKSAPTKAPRTLIPAVPAWPIQLPARSSPLSRDFHPASVAWKTVCQLIMHHVRPRSSRPTTTTPCSTSS